ncbi:MAG: class D beta-lactamase [Candidatus Protistobacter heckmanni]|nr:class D beta-lactamase [Candidatus Protistobacter heckmanni]
MKRRIIHVLAVSALLFCASLSRAETSCLLLEDAASAKILKQEGAVCDQRITPASTFKLALALMGYDAGYLVDEHLPRLPFHEGYADWMPNWKQPVDPAAWLRDSVVWYSQRLTEWLGMERFQRYAGAFHYGNADVSGDKGKNNGLTRAWLSSSLRISPLEQAAFLRKLARCELPVSARAFDMTERIGDMGVSVSGWRIHGKTGSGNAIKADGAPDADRKVGWFVGWARKDERTLVFVYAMHDEKREESYAGLRAKAALMARLPALLEGR